MMFESKYRRRALQSWQQSREQFKQEFAEEFGTKSNPKHHPVLQWLVGGAAGLRKIRKNPWP